MSDRVKNDAAPFERGTHWLVDASGCDPSALRDEARLRALLDEVLTAIALRVGAPPVWKTFDGHGGVTGMILLEESHLTVHTFPEHRYAAFDLYCCSPRAAFDWADALVRSLSATHIEVRALERARIDARSMRAPTAPRHEGASAGMHHANENANENEGARACVAPHTAGGATSPRDREG